MTSILRNNMNKIEIEPYVLLQEYLAQYGYLPSINSKNSELMELDKLRQAVKNFQLFAGLNATGMWSTFVPFVFSFFLLSAVCLDKIKTHSTLRHL